MAEFSLGEGKVGELLKEVTLDYSKLRPINDAVAALREVLLSLPEQQVSASLAPQFVKDLGVPENKARFQFVTPESVNVVGSYALKTVTKPNLTVDLAVRMPKSCFGEKDYLNHRYHAKRALYLAVIQRRFESCQFVARIECSSLCGDLRKPILVVHVVSKADAAQRIAVRVIPTIASDVFLSSKLALSRNNVRDAKADEGHVQPTPHYSSSILEDVFIEEHQEMLKDLLSGADVIRDVVCLLKVWSRQRGFHHSYDGVSSHLMTLLVAHLTTSAGGKRVRSHLSALQLFRIVMDSIANSDSLGKGVFLQFEEGLPVPNEKRRLTEHSFEVNICDPSCVYNLAHRVSKSALAEVKEAAAQTLAVMISSRDNGFDSVFMTPVHFAAKYDYHIRWDAAGNAGCIPSTSYCLDEESWRVLERRLESVLFRALQDRVKSVRVLRRTLPSGWDIKKGLTHVDKGPLFAGVVLGDVSTALRMATVGPSAERKDEAKEFRDFWGSKAELRRWPDGTITETAAWECQPWERHLVIKKIVEHVVIHHLGAALNDVHVVAGQLDFSVLESGKDLVSSTSKLVAASKVLSDRLRNLEQVPLKVVAVHLLSPAFRQAAVFPPETHPLADETNSQTPSKFSPRCLDPLEVAIELEGSGSWPADLGAVQKIKMAFLLKIAESLQRSWKVSYFLTKDAVDILMHGFAFRLSICYEKDPSIVSKTAASGTGSEGSREDKSTNSSSLGAVRPDEDLLLKRFHAKLLDSLQGLHPVFGPTVRLAKRWVAAHFLGTSVCDEAVELLVAYLFTNPYPFSPPSSRITGFVRFLNLLSTHDWDLVPIVVDVNKDMSTHDTESIMEHFDVTRLGEKQSQLKGPPMFISTPYDRFSRTWTLSSPSVSDLKKIVSYARAAAALIVRLIHKEDDKWASLFRTPFNCYDAVIHLHHESLPHPYRVLFKNDVWMQGTVCGGPWPEPIGYLSKSVVKLGADRLRSQLLIGFDPVACFVKDMKVKFGNITVFYDRLGGSDVVCLTMDKLQRKDPGKTESLERKRSAGGTKRKRIEGEVLVGDVKILVSAVCKVGHGLVRSVQLVEDPRKVF